MEFLAWSIILSSLLQTQAIKYLHNPTSLCQSMIQGQGYEADEIVLMSWSRYWSLYIAIQGTTANTILIVSWGLTLGVWKSLEQTKKHPNQLSHLWFQTWDGFCSRKKLMQVILFALEPLMTSPIQSIYLFLSHCRSVHLLITACVNRSVNLSLCSQLFFFSNSTRRRCYYN